MHRLRLNFKLLYSLLTRDLRTIHICTYELRKKMLVERSRYSPEDMRFWNYCHAVSVILSSKLVVEVQPKSVNFKIDFPLCTQFFFNLAPLNNYTVGYDLWLFKFKIEQNGLRFLTEKFICIMLAIISVRKASHTFQQFLQMLNG